ncbi:MAG: hypothetical protein JKY37_30370 [Nannocystaceae bacterium]|nr:hypothetical protein [Nannocystaceae bacterium]
MPELDPVTLASLVHAASVYAAFFFALLLAAKILPGKTYRGFPQPSGDRKDYKVNGLALWVATHMGVVAGVLWFDLSLASLIREFWSYFAVVNAASFAWMFILYLGGRVRGETARPGLLGFVQDYWYGVELNPTWRDVDLKTWAYQPSLIGLAILNASFGWTQWEQLGTLTPQMIAYLGFWWLYLTSHFWFEAGVLSMWDVIAEKFGFMLVWGNLVLVPFFYCIGGWWLIGQTEPMPLWQVGGVAGLHLLGLWIFRGANAQKDQFKRTPERPIWGRPPETIGGRLLVSGWWGFGRKINYTGEIMVYFSFALCTGMQSLIPYLLPLWLCVLLPHRAWRDEKRCSAKYGELWEQYTKRARFRMIPFLY